MTNQDYINYLNEKKTSCFELISQKQQTLTTIDQQREAMRNNIISLDNQEVDTNNAIPQLTNEIATIDEMIAIFST